MLSTQLEKCAQDLGSTSKTVGSSMAQLLTCAAQGNEHYTGKAISLQRSDVRSITNHFFNNLVLSRFFTLYK